MKLTSALKLHFMVGVVGAALFASGCANMSTLQTARVEKPSAGKLTLGGGYTQFPDLSAATGNTVQGLPYLEGMYRHGIVDNLDIGIRATIIGTVGLDAKYQLLDMNNFALSVGAGAGYFSSSTTVGNTTVTATDIDITVPIYASYDFTNWFALYVSPKFLGRIVTGSGVSTTGFSPYIGGSLGFKLGDKWGFLGEGTYGIALARGLANQTQVSGAFFWGFGG